MNYLNPHTHDLDDQATRRVLAEIAAERQQQDQRWGEQNHPDGTGPQYAESAEYERTRTNNAATDGTLTWRHILREEVAEALAENDLTKLRAELLQVAAVAACWVESIDRRAALAARRAAWGSIGMDHAFPDADLGDVAPDRVQLPSTGGASR